VILASSARVRSLTMSHSPMKPQFIGQYDRVWWVLQYHNGSYFGGYFGSLGNTPPPVQRVICPESLSSLTALITVFRLKPHPSISSVV